MVQARHIHPMQYQALTVADARTDAPNCRRWARACRRTPTAAPSAAAL